MLCKLLTHVKPICYSQCNTFTFYQTPPVLYMCEIERRRKKGNEEEQRRGGEGRKECRGNVGAGRIGIHEKDREIYIFWKSKFGLWFPFWNESPNDNIIVISFNLFFFFPLGRLLISRNNQVKYWEMNSLKPRFLSDDMQGKRFFGK